MIDGFFAIDTPFSEASKARFSFGIRKQDGYVTRPDGTDLGDYEHVHRHDQVAVHADG